MKQQETQKLFDQPSIPANDHSQRKRLFEFSRHLIFIEIKENTEKTMTLEDHLMQTYTEIDVASYKTSNLSTLDIK